MLTKIVSGGQTGADRAALDVAIKFNIPHGGWVPKGRKTESGSLPLKYHLAEMRTDDYRDRTRQNIVDSQGTAIISRGALSGGSFLTRQFATLSQRPNCHINLAHNDAFEASVILQSFILENNIRVLNVAGPRASHDPGIYFDVKTILEATLYLFFLDRDLPADTPFRTSGETVFPSDMQAAVTLLSGCLSFRDKAALARMDDADLMDLYFIWLEPVREKLGFDTGNAALLAACTKDWEPSAFTVEDAVMEILKALKRYCSQAFRLKVVK